MKTNDSLNRSAALASIAVAVLLVGLWAFQTANRLDRLHVRYDLSWQALDGALARRACARRHRPIRPLSIPPSDRG